MFFDVFWIFSKKTNVFFGFSRFLVLENLENPKNTMCFFGFFRSLLKNPKNNMIFLDFSIETTENPKKNYRFFFWIFKNFQKQKL